MKIVSIIDHMNDDDRPFKEMGARLRTLREMKGKTRSAWIAQHGYNLSQYTHWENGWRQIPVGQAGKLVKKYGVTLDWVYYGNMHTLPQHLFEELEAFYSSLRND